MIRSKTRLCTVRSQAYVVFLAKGPRTIPILKRASVASAFITYSGLEKERDFRLVVELP